MGHTSKYRGTYPSEWSDWDWNVQHECYVRYRLVGKGDYEWDTYQPEPEFEDEYYLEEEDYPEPIPTLKTPQYTCTFGSTSDFTHDDYSQQSDRDSGYHSASVRSEGFEDLLDHPNTWTVNPFLAFGFPPAKDSKDHHRHQKQQQHSRTQTSGLDISRTSLHSDEGFSEPKPDPWITLFGTKHKHSQKEVNVQPSVDLGSNVCYVSHSVLKDLGLWDSRSTRKSVEAWISGTEKGCEERIKVVGSWCVSWVTTFKEGKGSGNKMQRTTFKVFKDRKRRVIMGMSPKEARKFGLS